MSADEDPFRVTLTWPCMYSNNLKLRTHGLYCSHCISGNLSGNKACGTLNGPLSSPGTLVQALKWELKIKIWNTLYNVNVSKLWF